MSPRRPSMVSSQSEPGAVAAVKAPVAPWRGPAASGLRLGPAAPSSMPPPPPFLVQPRTSSWPPPRKGSSFPPPPLALTLSIRSSDRDADFLDEHDEHDEHDEDDEKEDMPTNVFAEPVTLVTQKDGAGAVGLRKGGWGEGDESTHELERPTQKRLPTMPPPPPRPLPPTGYEVLSASLAAASLAPQGFTVA